MVAFGIDTFVQKANPCPAPMSNIGAQSLKRRFVEMRAAERRYALVAGALSSRGNASLTVSL
jgi:hypothetical protein